VRDLLWLLGSPPLLATAPVSQALAHATPGWLARTADWLAQLDRAGETLHATLAAAPQKRLGHYAEQLLAFALDAGLSGRLIAANLPLRRGNQTLGECDFLLEAHDGTRLHWELAVKCYLYVAPDEQAWASAQPDTPASTPVRHEVDVLPDAHGAAAGPWQPFARYVGPNLADRFDLKLARMFDHQLRLSARPEFAAQIGGGPWHAELFLRGWLFYPLPGLSPHAQTASPTWTSPATAPQPGPALLGADHLRGWWGTVDAWRQQAARSDAQVWQVLPRLQWMAPRRVDTDSREAAALLEADALYARLVLHFGAAGAAHAPQPSVGAALALPGPWLIAGFARRGDGWVEVTRGFVVDDGWPVRAQHYAYGQA